MYAAQSIVISCTCCMQVPFMKDWLLGWGMRTWSVMLWFRLDPSSAPGRMGLIDNADWTKCQQLPYASFHLHLEKTTAAKVDLVGGLEANWVSNTARQACVSQIFYRYLYPLQRSGNAAHITAHDVMYRLACARIGKHQSFVKNMLFCG